MRAVVVVHPNNPTGSRLSSDEARALSALCAERDLALVSDEVFADFTWPDASSEAPASLLGAAREAGCLGAALGGLSKSCGLPQVKLAWIALAGPESLVAETTRRLEIVSDTLLSASGPAQAAAPAALLRSDGWRARAAWRIATNRETLADVRALRAAPAEAGWHVVLESRDGRDLGADLEAALAEDDVAVAPGRLFDLGDDCAVVSLLGEPRVFADGIGRLDARLSG